MPHQPDSHHDHDLALVAALAAGDAQGRDQARATELVTSCTECALVRDDLVAIASSLRTLPAPRRTRDYRLTAEQAATLRPTGWRRLLGAFGGTGFRFATPVGTAMATLGIAGLLLSSVPSTLPAGTTGDGTTGAGGAPAAPASDATMLESLVPSLGYGLTGGSAIPDASASGAAYLPAATEITKANASAAAPSAAPSAAASIESLTSTAASAPPATRAASLDQATATADTSSSRRVTSSPTALVFTSLLLVVGGAMLVLLRAASRRVTPV